MAAPSGQSDDPVAQFPTTVFDGISESRPTGKEFAAPEANDWQQIVNEVIAIEKAVRPAYDDLNIWVNPNGVAANATGSITNPYTTLALAFAAISATKKTVCLMPGTYTLAAAQALPVTQDGVKIIGFGDVIIAGADADQALSLTPGAQGAAFTISLKNIKITQYAAKKGLYIDDTAIDGAVTVNLDDCEFTMDTTGSSIDLLHAEAQAVTINCINSTFTGPVALDAINASDVFEFTRCKLTGGIVSDAGAVAADIILNNSEVLHAGVTGGNAAQVLTVNNCWTPLAPFDFNDAAGSQTATIKTENNVFVDANAVASLANGSVAAPYKTIGAGIAALTATRSNLVILPGSYTLVASTALPVDASGYKIIGVGGASAVVIAGGNFDQAFSLTPGAQGAAFVITLEGFTLNQYAAKKGLYIDDTAIDDTVTVNLKDVIFVMDTSGSSIDLLHAVDQTVTINATNSTFGPITLDCINASDAFNFTYCDLSGGIVTDAGAVAAAFVFKFCTLKASGMSGGHSSQTIIALGCYASDNTAVETGEFAGSHTETLIAP
jgi:hypothetical protein